MLCALMLLAFWEADVPAGEKSSDLYQQGMEAFKSGNYGSAGLIFRKIVDADDEYRDRAWYQLGLAVFKQKKYESAIFEFNRFLLECTTSNLCALSRYWIAESEYSRKNFIKAIEEYNRFIAQSPDEKMAGQAMRRIGDIYFLQSRYDEAVLVWEKTLNALEDESRKRKLSLKIGEALFLGERFDEALSVLEPLRVNKADAKTAAKSSILLGRIHQIKGDHRKALRYFTQVPDSLLKDRPYSDAQYFKSKSFLELGQKNAAKSNLELFLIIGKDSEWVNEAKYELGRLMLEEKKESKGVKLLEEARISTTKMELRSNAAMELAKVYLKKSPREAIPYLEDSVSVNDPEEQKKAILLLSRGYVDVERFEDAERLLNLLVEKYPFDENIDEFHYLLSRAHLGRGDLEGGFAEIKKIREVNPRSNFLNETHYYLGIALAGAGKIEKSLEHLKTYIQLKNPEKHFEARIKLHEIYFDGGDYDNSRKMFDSIMRLYRTKNDIDALAFKTGLAYREKGVEYEKPFDFVLEKNPRSDFAGEVCIIRGDDAFKKRDYVSAERWYRQFLLFPERENAGPVFLYRIISLYKLDKHADVVKAVKDEKSIPMDDFTAKLVHFWEGKSQYKTGRIAEAYSILKNYDLDNFSDEDLSMLVEVSLHEKDVERAKRAARTLMRNPERSAEAHYEIGKFFAMRREDDLARAFFGEVINKYPESLKTPHARAELAELEVRAGRYERALDELAKVDESTLNDRKNALRITCLFSLGKAHEAEELTEKNIQLLKSSPYGEIAFKENMIHYFFQGDEDKFKSFAGMLRRYPGTGTLVEYYTAKLEFNRGMYNNAYYSFYKLSSAENEYRREALYHLGLISYYKQGNPVKAAGYFEKLAKDERASDPFVQKAILFLAIDSRMKGDDKTAEEYLARAIGSASNLSTAYRAMNLYEYFGFYKEKKGTKTSNGKIGK